MGSRVYHTHTEVSDWDFLIVATEEFPSTLPGNSKRVLDRNAPKPSSLSRHHYEIYDGFNNFLIFNFPYL